MRLIDADKAGAELACYHSPTGIVDETLYGFASNIINEAPTVEAIPVEWLLKRAKLCTKDYADCLYYSVEAWQTEQKYMVNGQWKFSKDGEKENEG